MKKTKFLSMICASLLGCAFFAATPAVTATAQERDFDCAFSASQTGDPNNYVHYGCTEIVTYTEAEAAQAGLPDGYSGSVVSVLSNVINRGVTLDFSSYKIPTSLVESITFRVYVGDDGNPNDAYPEVRIPMPFLSGAWAMRYPFGDKTNQWVDVVLKNGNDSFFKDNGTKGFESLSVDGYLNKFELSMRHNGSVGIFYIDSVTVALVDDGGVPPELIYDGEDVVTIGQGQTLPFNVSAIDAIEGAVDVEYVWGDPTALDENGNPKVGTHTLTFKASDYFGNSSEKTITVIVEEPDVTSPVIAVPTHTVYAKIGATPCIRVQATDDKTKNVALAYAWSENALDARGKLTEGEHTLTVTAVDLSGNTAEERITFIVTQDGDTVDIIIDEELLCPDVEEPESSESESTQSEEMESESIQSEEIESEEVESMVESSDEASNKDSEEQSALISSEKETSSKGDEKTSGCAGAISGVSAAVLCAFVGGLIFKKKEK